MNIPSLLKLQIRRSVPCNRTHTTTSPASQLIFSTAPTAHQAFPLSGFYSVILHNPLSRQYVANKPHDSQTPVRPKLTFASRLAGPISFQYDEPKQAAQKAKVERIGGVIIPPRPDEPDNCCMSGCAHCVWDIYREDMESWMAQRASAEQALHQQEHSRHLPVSEMKPSLGGDTAKEDVFAAIPIGIRQFMELEKRLKSAARERERAHS